MKTVMNVAEAKAKLSELIDRAERGEEVVIARKGKAVVRLVTEAQGDAIKPDRANLFGLYEHLGPVLDAALEPEPLDAWYSELPIPGFEPKAKKAKQLCQRGNDAVVLARRHGIDAFFSAHVGCICPPMSRKPSLPAQALLVGQRVYKLTLSPLIGQQCRYLPTCSDYAAQCVRLHGAWAGSWMGLARLCRCRPGGGAGYDPAPLVCEAVSPWTPWKMGDWKGPLDNSQTRPVE